MKLFGLIREEAVLFLLFSFLKYISHHISIFKKDLPILTLPDKIYYSYRNINLNKICNTNPMCDEVKNVITVIFY